MSGLFSMHTGFAPYTVFIPIQVREYLRISYSGLLITVYRGIGESKQKLAVDAGC